MADRLIKIYVDDEEMVCMVHSWDRLHDLMIGSLFDYNFTRDPRGFRLNGWPFDYLPKGVMTYLKHGDVIRL